MSRLPFWLFAVCSPLSLTGSVYRQRMFAYPMIWKTCCSPLTLYAWLYCKFEFQKSSLIHWSAPTCESFTSRYYSTAFHICSMASSQPPPTFPQSYLDEYIGYRLRNTAIVFILIETLFVGLRVWARRFTRSPIGWDDYLVPLGLLTSIGTSITGLRERFRWRPTSLSLD